MIAVSSLASCPKIMSMAYLFASTFNMISISYRNQVKCLEFPIQTQDKHFASIICYQSFGLIDQQFNPETPSLWRSIGASRAVVPC